MVEASDSSAQDKKLSDGEIKKLQKGLKKAGDDVHWIKPGPGQDLFKKPNGDICVKPKSGIGEGEPTGLNINDY